MDPPVRQVSSYAFASGSTASAAHRAVAYHKITNPCTGDAFLDVSRSFDVHKAKALSNRTSLPLT